jgi:AraC-like DNA-binding protein
VGISRSHLHRKMKELTGLPISDFIQNVRMEQAARLLTEQKQNISQVAYSVGFSYISTFSTVFKKHFGMSPTEYIKQHQ